MVPPSTSSSSKALGAILPLIASGQAYEAHQKARTFASRYSKSSQYDTAIQVLFQSAKELLKASQQGSGTDLTVFLLEVYENKGEVVDEESRGRLTQLIALTGSSGTWRKTIIDRSIAWTAKAGPWPTGDPDLQHYVAELLYKEGAFVEAEPHFLAAGKRDSARLLADMFVQWSNGQNPGHFVLHGVLPYLENGNILAARTFMNQFVNKFIATYQSFASPNQTEPLSLGGSDEIIVTTDSTTNFAQLAVRLCQRAQGDKNKALRESWVRLCGTYQSRGGILALPEIRKTLTAIGELYFSIPAPRGQPVNPLGDMFSALLGGGAPGGGQKPQRRTLSPAIAASDTAGLD